MTQTIIREGDLTVHVCCDCLNAIIGAYEEEQLEGARRFRHPNGCSGMAGRLDRIGRTGESKEAAA